MKLRPYQEEAITFLYERNKAMLLASMGAGKTAIMLHTMQELLQEGVVERFLVLAPLRVCNEVWVQERDKWVVPITMDVATGSSSERLKALTGNAQVVVMNYENLQWLSEQPVFFDGLVCDELSKLKNPSGKRFKSLMKILDRFKIRYGMTGSFTSNGLEDVFGQCRVIDQSLLGRFKNHFLKEYFFLKNREFFEYEPFPDALQKVMARIKPATFVLANQEYKDKLPPLHMVFLDCEMGKEEYLTYNKMKRDFALQFDTQQVIAANAGVVTNKLQQGASGFYYPTNDSHKPIWLSKHKFEQLDELMDENQHDATLVFYNFEAEKQELLRRYPHAQTLDNNNIIERWNKGEVEMLIAHPKSASHGLNLQGYSNKVVYISLPWSMELFEQSVARVHRGGQKREVWCYILRTKNTIDEIMWDSLMGKKAVSEIAIQALK